MEEPKINDPQSGKNAVPANPGAEDKSRIPDPDQTDAAESAAISSEAEQSLEENRFGSEHDISPDHAEPTDVTDTSNDKYIDGEYIDVGGGD